jgi:Leucine-rich repeat (LRR) protein
MSILPTELDEFCIAKRMSGSDIVAITVRNWDLTSNQASMLSILPKLQDIEVDSRKIEVYAARKLVELKGVKRLSFTSGAISDAHIAAMSDRLWTLRALTLCGSSITCESIRYIADTELEEFSLVKTSVSDACLEVLSKGRIALSLRALSFNPERNTKHLNIVALGKFVNMTSLSLRGAQIDDTDTPLLPSSLRSLDLSETAITDLSGNTLSSMKALSHLSVQRTVIGNEFVHAFRNHPTLSAIELDCTRIDEGAVSSIESMPELAELSAHGTRISYSDFKCQTKLRLSLDQR